MISRITVTAIAVVATLVVFMLARLVDVSPQIPEEFATSGDTDMGAENVLFVTIFLGLSAMLVAWLVDRFTSEGKRIWSIVAIVVFALSFIPLFQLGLTGAALLWQVLLHTVFALILIGGFWTTWDERAAAEAAGGDEGDEG